MTRRSKADAEAAKAQLLEILKPGDEVYTVLRKVSASGMTRLIDLYIFRANAWDGKIQPQCLNVYAESLGFGRDHKTGHLKVQGAGMDMGFHVVYGIGLTLWPHGTPEPHGTRNGVPDSDGGYSLKQRWL